MVPEHSGSSATVNQVLASSLLLLLSGSYPASNLEAGCVRPERGFLLFLWKLPKELGIWLESRGKVWDPSPGSRLPSLRSPQAILFPVGAAALQLSLLSSQGLPGPCWQAHSQTGMQQLQAASMFPLRWVSQPAVPRTDSLCGCRCVWSDAVKQPGRASGDNWSKNHIQHGVGERWLYMQLSVSYGLQSRRDIFNGNVLDWQRNNFSFNISSQITAKPGVAEASSKVKGMRAFNLPSWKGTQRQREANPSCLEAPDFSYSHLNT